MKYKEDKKPINENLKTSIPKRLYLRNLPFQITEDDKKNNLKNINEIHIPINHKKNESFDLISFNLIFIYFLKYNLNN